MNNEELKGLRGQLTVIGIMMVFISLITFIALRPVLVQAISDAGFTGSEKMIAEMFPFMILIGILGSLVLYLWPERTQNY